MPSKGRQLTGRRMRKRLSAMSVAKANRRKLNALHEPKYRDIAPQTITTATAGTIITLSNIATGSTDITRIGEKIHAERLLINIHDADYATAQAVRVIVFVDKQQHGTDPAVTDLLNTANTISLTNRSNFERFTILRDITYPKSNDTGVVQNKRFNIRLNRNIHYIGDTSTEPSNGAGSIYMLVISYQAGAASSFRYSSRMTFTD